MASKNKILKELKAHRETLFQVLKQFDENEWAQPLARGKWTLQDMVVHLTHWHRWGLNKLRQIVVYGIIDQTGPRDTDELNKLIAKAWAQHSIFDIKADLEGIFEQMINFVSTLPDEWFNRTWSYVGKEVNMQDWFDFFLDHDRKHIKELKAIKGRGKE